MLCVLQSALMQSSDFLCWTLRNDCKPGLQAVSISHVMPLCLICVQSLMRIIQTSPEIRGKERSKWSQTAYLKLAGSRVLRFLEAFGLLLVPPLTLCWTSLSPCCSLSNSSTYVQEKAWNYCTFDSAFDIMCRVWKKLLMVIVKDLLMIERSLVEDFGTLSSHILGLMWSFVVFVLAQVWFEVYKQDMEAQVESESEGKQAGWINPLALQWALPAWDGQKMAF